MEIKPEAELVHILLAGVIAAESETQTVTVPADPAIPGSAEATVSQVCRQLHYRILQYYKRNIGVHAKDLETLIVSRITMLKSALHNSHSCTRQEQAQAFIPVHQFLSL